MNPTIELDETILCENAVRWRRHAGVPVWPVLKNDGYGWGAVRLARALDGVAGGYFVADADEFEALRAATDLPIALLLACGPARLAGIVERGGIPTVASLDEIAAAIAFGRARGTPVRVRLGIRPAAGWSGIDAAEVDRYAAACAGDGLEVALWTHVTSPDRAPAQQRVLDDAAARFRALGATVAELDADATASAAAGRERARVRIGAGLFGARCGNAIAPLACAIAVRAPIVARHAPGAVTAAGYGDDPLPPGVSLLVGRCGYGDGFPRAPGRAGVVATGMQYTIAHDRGARIDGDALVLLDRDDDLDALAAAAGRLPHEIIVALGHGLKGGTGRPGPACGAAAGSS